MLQADVPAAEKACMFLLERSQVYMRSMRSIKPWAAGYKLRCLIVPGCRTACTTKLPEVTLTHALSD